MLRSGPVGWLTLALLAGWLASCSADVSGYHLETDTGGGAGAVGGSTSSSGGGISMSGSGAIGGRGTGGGATGGAGTGGVRTGGAGAGGTGAGGAGTGGAGGTGQWPSDPHEVSLSSGVSGVTAAAWQPSTRRFFLLMPNVNQYVTVDTAGTVGTPVNLPTGTIAPTAFGVSATDVFFIVGTTLYRQPVGAGAPVTTTLPGNPASKTLSGAYAKGWFFVGNASGASAALQDGQMTLDANAPNLTQLYVVTTDGSGFAFRTLGATNISVLHLIAPGSFALNGAPCSAGISNDQSVGVYANNVAWVVRSPTTNPYTLNIAPTNGGVCGPALTAPFGVSGNGSQAVGLIDATHALVTPTAVVGSATIDIKQVAGTLTRTPLQVTNTGTIGFPAMFVVGVETVTHYAVLVTKDIPVLVSF